jgi:alpha/beta superfamily hydrolase
MQQTVNTLPTKALPPEGSRGDNHRAPQQHLTGEPSAKERLKKHHPIIRILYRLCMIALLSACGPIHTTPTPTQMPHFDAQEVSFTTEDGLKIYGKIYRGGPDLAVILAHQRDKMATQKSWQFFAELLATKGYTALTYDFRGIGRSEGDINYMESEIVKDTSAAIEFLQSQGFSRIVCIGASMGGTSCLEAALHHDLQGLVVIAAPMSLGEPTKITMEDLEALTVPKLFICTENDRFGRIPKHTRLMYDNSPEPKQLKFFTGNAHGTELFYTSHKEEFRQLLLHFLQDLP